MNCENLRALLPALKHSHFFNYASASPLFQTSAQEMKRVVEQNTRPLPEHFNEWIGLVEVARRRVADTIGAQLSEITFVANTSTALSLIAASIKWAPDDRVIYPADEFPSNRYVWQNLHDYNVKAEALEYGRNRNFLEVLKNTNLKNIRLVSLSAVSYRDGKKENIGEIVRFCHQHGIWVAIDGAQAVGAIPVSVQKWGCDFLACGGQKWLFGPVGSGFLYIKDDIQEKCHVPLVGWASSEHAGDFETTQLKFCEGARRFEPGLPDIAAIAGLSSSLETLERFGWESLFETIAENNNFLRQSLRQLDYPLLNEGPPEIQSGIVTVEMNSIEEATAFHRECESQKIILTQRQRFIRIAMHATTGPDDREFLLAFFKKWRKKNSPASAKRGALLKTELSEVSGPSRHLSWKEALILGASRGLGAALAEVLAESGCNVSLVGRDQEALSRLADRLHRQYAVSTEIHLLDLGNRSELTQWLQKYQHQFPKYDLLINNAAEADANLFAKTPIARIYSMVETNFVAPMIVARNILPFMLERGKGAILNIVTAGGRCSLPLFSIYSATKGGLWAWSESLNRELKKSGITITTFLPPHMGTSTAQQLGRKALAYYTAEGGQNRQASPFQVARKALKALQAGKTLVVPFTTRLKLGMNMFFPNLFNPKNFIF